MHKHLVVAYGSNLNTEDWAEFCRRNDRNPCSLKFLERVICPDYRLVFNRFSRSRNGGVLNIKRAVGHIVEACLFEVSDDGLQSLRLKEGHPNAYLEQDIIVLDKLGNEILAKTYVVPPERCSDFFRPTEEYLRVCREGYKRYGLNDNNLLLAAQNKMTKPLSEVFAYGSLMRGEDNYDIIRNSVKGVCMAFSWGKLFYNSRFPELKVSEFKDFSNENVVWGDGFFIYEEDVERTLQTLDQFEGFNGFGAQRNFYRRTVVEACTGNSGGKWWAYVVDNPTSATFGHDWRQYTGKHIKFYEALAGTHFDLNPSAFSETRSEIITSFVEGKDRFELNERYLLRRSGSMRVLV